MTEVVTWRWTLLATVVVTGLLGLSVVVGGDWDWMVAVGDHVRATGSVPDDVPFAVADTSGWRDVPVLGQLVASVLHDLGPRAVVVLHLASVAVVLAVVARTARQGGARDSTVAWSLALVLVGGLTGLGVVRAQTLSLVPFALVVALVVRQHRRPDRGVWWAVPLVAVWANLHGAVLLGTCVLGAYLVVDRLPRRPLETVLVGAASLLALCLTPQLWHTPDYYLAVFDNVSAQRNEGLWARPSPGSPFDVAMVLAALVLLVVLLRRRRSPWEYVVVAGLCVATLSAARHGVWLLLLLAALAPARGRAADAAAGGEAGEAVGAADTDAGAGPVGPVGLVGPVVAVALALAVAVPVTLARGSAVLRAHPDVVEQVVTVVRDAGRDDGAVLAPAPLSESLAVAGLRLWAGNPLDAFGHDDQAAFLDFVDGLPGGRAAVEQADVVVVGEGSPSEDLVADDPAFTAVPCGRTWVCYLRG